MLCIPWRFFSTEEHFSPPHSLLRLCLIRPFSCSTGTRQPLQPPACWEPSTATALPAPGLRYSACPDLLPFQPLSWHLVKNVWSWGQGWGLQSCNLVCVHVLGWFDFRELLWFSCWPRYSSNALGRLVVCPSGKVWDLVLFWGASDVPEPQVAPGPFPLCQDV